MPRRSIHRRRRAQGGCLSFAIGVLTVTALALVVAIIITNRLKPPADGVVAPGATGGDGFVDANNPPVEDYQMVLTAGDLVQEDREIVVLTPSPSPTPEPTPTPQPTYNPDDPYGLVRPQPTEKGYLPVFEKANTDKRQIAITLDECFGATITSKFAKEAVKYGAKLTIFPSGENVMKKGMGEVLKQCFYSLGFEIENRC